MGDRLAGFLRQPDAVVLEHNLKLTIARWRGVLVVRRIAPDSMLLGIPGWGSNSLETLLVVGRGWGEKMREMQARRLRFVATELRSTDTYYPAFASAMVALILRHPGVRTRTIPDVPEQVAWLSVTSDGLAWKAGAR